MIRTVWIHDLRFQWRHGFYAVYAVVSLLYVAVLVWIPSPVRGTVAKVIVFSDPTVLGFIFSAGMLLLEKSQGVPAALFVSPLSPGRWVLARALSLSVLSSLAGLVVLMGGMGADVRTFAGLLALMPGSSASRFWAWDWPPGRRRSMNFWSRRSFCSPPWRFRFWSWLTGRRLSGCGGFRVMPFWDCCTSPFPAVDGPKRRC